MCPKDVNSRYNPFFFTVELQANTHQVDRAEDKLIPPSQATGVYRRTPEDVVNFCKSNGVRVMFDQFSWSPDDIDAFASRGLFFLVDLFRCKPETIGLVMQKMKEYPGLVWGCVWGESDSRLFSRCDKTFATRQEIYQWCWSQDALDEQLMWDRENNPIRVRNVTGQGVPCGNFAEAAREGQITSDMDLIAHCGKTYLIHDYFRRGFKMVWLERNGVHSGLQIGIAFLRGACKQFGHGRLWGLDFSPWNNLKGVGVPLYFDEGGVQMSGVTPKLLAQQFFVSFASGANLVHQQIDDVTHYYLDKTGKKHFSELGEFAQRFGKYALMDYSDRGEPYVPFALLLDRLHGWDSPRWDEGDQWIWDNRVPRGPADRMLDEAVEVFFPGYRLAGHSGDNNYHADLPWKNEDERLVYMRSGKDVRFSEKGELVASPYGDSLDILTDDCPVEKMIEYYKVIWPVGTIKIDANLTGQLEKFVRAGGEVILNTGQMPKDSPVWELAGVELKEYFYWTPMISSKCLVGESKEWAEGFVNRAAVEVKDAEVLACCNTAIPMVTVRKLGKGLVWYFSPYYMMPITWKIFSPVCRYWLEKILSRHWPVEIEGQSVETVLSETNEGLLLSLIEVAGQNFHDEIHLRCRIKDNRDVQVLDQWNDKIIEHQIDREGITFKPELPAWGVAAIHCKGIQL